MTTTNHNDVGTDASPWTALAAKEIGESHVRKQMPCQDYCCIDEAPNGTVLGALSDGIGSAAHAEEGAELAVYTAFGHLWQNQEAIVDGGEKTIRAICAAAMELAADAIRAEARKKGKDPDDFACTLILLIVRPQWIAAMGVGDGFITWRPADSSEHEVLIAPEKGEFVNYADAIPSADLATCARFAFRDKKPPAFALASSDGLLYLALQSQTWKPHAPFFQFVESLTRRPDVSKELVNALLRSPKVAELSDDDKSLLIVCAKEHVPPPAPPPIPPLEVPQATPPLTSSLKIAPAAPPLIPPLGMQPAPPPIPPPEVPPAAPTLIPPLGMPPAAPPLIPSLKVSRAAGPPIPPVEIPPAAAAPTPPLGIAPEKAEAEIGGNIDTRA
jgi:hypothetical protein